jgi:TonB family protein
MPFRDSQLSPFVVGSIVVHVIFALFIVFWPGFGSSSNIPDDIVIVDVVAAVPAGPPPAPPPVVETAPTPEPEPQVETEGVKIEPEDVKPPKEDPPPPEPKPEKKKSEEIKKPAPARPEPATDTPPVGDAAGTGPGGGAETPGSGVVGVDLGALGHAWYRDSVAAMLRRNWVRPVLEAREALEVTVAFEILRDGTVRNVRIGEASGVQSLDRSALRAVVDASPLPPLPSSWREPAVSAQFLFRWLPGEN